MIETHNIYSNTKLFTVVAVMQLVEQQKLTLCDYISNYLPAFGQMFYRAREGLTKAVPITIYQLLTMISGLGYDSMANVDALLAATNGKSGTLEIISAPAKEPLNFDPGKRWLYGRSYDMLGAVIEVISGMRLGDYFKKHIMDPLGMQHTAFNFSDPYA